ncbi:hypothetical protein [Embleya sp. NPDC059237]|uniref:hypothetical protein n=1 Tax=Embleya sp. NPDC059237 TaxID=3346784 RepID=UPI003673DEE8
MSGRQHRGYKLFRAAMKDVLSAVPDSYEQLAARAPKLAEARNTLLEADIVDGEHLHRSIAQKPDGPDNAVAELRHMRHRRAGRYASLIRFGDHYIADAVAGLRHP